MLRRVLEQISVTEPQQVSMNGNSALDFALLVKLVINTLKQCQKSVTDCVATHPSRHKKLASIVCVKLIDGISRGIDTLIQHVRKERLFPLTEHESKELFRQYCRPGGSLSRQNGESMKQYVSSRRRRCWILLVQMDRVIRLSEGYRSGMSLDLSGLTREERVMVQASISNARDFDRVHLHPKPSSSNFHVFISGKVKDERRAKAKTN